MPFGLGFGELVLIFAVMLLLFGAKRLPEVAQGMGKGIRDFKRAINGMDEQSIAASPVAAPIAQPAPLAQVQAAAEPQSQLPG